MAWKKKEKKKEKDKEKEKEKDEEDLAEEEVKSAEADEKETIRDDEDDKQKDDSGPKEKSGKTGRSLIRRWWIPGLLIFIFIAAGAAVLIQPDLLNIIKGKKKSVPSIDLTNDNLQEDALSPFFIPPSADLTKSAVRIDLTVIWDGVASVRYKTNELRIRAEVYDYLMDIDRESEDLDALKASMEEGMSGILRKSLGTNDLAIRIKELKII